MCGRFENNYMAAELFEKLVKIFPSIDSYEDINFNPVNIAPTQQIQTIIKEGDKLKLVGTNWGIKFSDKSPLIFNSRIETIKEKPNWRDLFDINRSLVVMTAFYEWMTLPMSKKKQPNRISIPGRNLFFVPAISIKMKDSDIYCTSLITTTPNRFIEQIHHRMPVIITEYNTHNYFNYTVDELIEKCRPLQDSIPMKAEEINL